MNVKDIIQNFYNNLAQKNGEWQKHLSDNVIFSDASKKLQAKGKDEFIQTFDSFIRCLEKVQLKKLITEGDSVCAVVSYDYISPKGDKLHQDDAEVWRVENDEIIELTIYFDITEFRNFMTK